jgi:hypothetical protein
MLRKICTFVLTGLLLICMLPVAEASGCGTSRLESMSVNGTGFSVGDTVTFQLVATDPYGIYPEYSYSYVMLENKSGYNCNWQKQLPLSGTGTADTYTAGYKFQSGDPAGSYSVAYVCLKNNKHAYTTVDKLNGVCLSNMFKLTLANGTASDKAGPVLGSLTADKTAAAAGETVTFTASAADPSGVQTVKLTLKGPGDPRVIELQPNAAKPGEFTGAFLIADDVASGLYEAESISLWDTLGNTSEYPECGKPLPEAFRFSVAVNNPKLPPSLTSFVTGVRFSPDTVKQGDPIQVSVSVDSKGIALPDKATLNCKCTLCDGGETAAHIPLEKKDAGTYTGSFVIPPEWQPGEYTVGDISFGDAGASVSSTGPKSKVKCEENGKFTLKSVFKGTENASIPLNGGFNDRDGVSAGNITEGDLTGRIEVSGTVGASKVGLYLLRYRLPSAYKSSASDTATHYYMDFRWVGVTPPDTVERCGSCLVLSDGDVAIDTNGVDVALQKNGKPAGLTNPVTAEGNYTVSVKPAAYTSKMSVKCEDEKTGTDSAKFAVDRSAPVIHAFVNVKSNSDIGIKVMTEDASGVSELKWANGARDAAYFEENGESFCGDFSVDAMGTYTVFAEDYLGHASVCVIEINSAIKAMKPGVSKKFAPGYPNKLDIEAKAANGNGSVCAEIYSKDGQWIASANSAGKAGKVYAFTWDGKLDTGNGLGQTDGAYAPASSGGTVYKVMIGVTDRSHNTVYATPQNVKLYSGLKIKSASVTGAKFKAGKGRAGIKFKLSMPSDVVVKIMNAAKTKVYAELKLRDAAADKLLTLYWDGKATSGNTAGLKSGKLVPKGSYRAVIYAGGMSKTLSAKLKVTR